MLKINRHVTVNTLLFWLATVALVLFLSVSLSHALPVTYSVSAASMDLVTYTGSLTVDLDQALGPVRNLAGSMGYAASDFTLTALSSWSYLPSYTFSSATIGDSAEYCLGRCVMGADANTIRFVNSTGLALQLAFAPDLLTAGSWYAQGIFGPMITVTSASVSPVPISEPGTAWLLLTSLAVSTCCWRTERSKDEMEIMVGVLVFLLIFNSVAVGVFVLWLQWYTQ